MADKKKLAVAAGLAVLIAMPAEGLRRVAYRDPVGILTVCYGDTHHVDPQHTYRLDECRARLTVEMARAIDTVERCVPGLPQTVLAAFGDAVYNLGPTIACDPKNSTAARLLASGRLFAACSQLPRWDKAKVAGIAIVLPGLTRRRQQEYTLCVKGLT